MRTAALAGLIVSVALAGCGGHAVQINPNAAPLSSRWNATLATPPELQGVVQVSGSAWVGQSEKDSSKTQAHIEIANAVPGAQHPWHVHIGQCGTDQGILGQPDAYRVLKVGGDGKAKADARLPMPTPKSGQYYVDVHASPRNMQSLVACGNMAPPAQ